MQSLKNRLNLIETQIRTAEEKADRVTNSVRLLAVSKTWPSSKLREVAAEGQRCFGENYLQEALSKIKELEDLSLEWHFIGPIQSNKTRDIAQYFDWVQSVDRPKIAQRLSVQRPESMPPLNVCIQVNIDAEQTKSGVSPDDVMSLAQTISAFDNLRLRGLMVIPQNTDDITLQRASFHRAFELYTDLKNHYETVDTLSMGMSNDMDIAIAEGSNMVRIGSALFGQRSTSQHSAQVN
jgi:hypothetical protein